jgi:hypothetical protein
MKRRQTFEHLGRVLDFYLDDSLNYFGRCAFLSKHEVHHSYTVVIMYIVYFIYLVLIVKYEV